VPGHLALGARVILNPSDRISDGIAIELRENN
jgi:hypothetical protein